MGKVQQYRKGISGFIASENGQRFFNFAYSIGAAIVIWGACSRYSTSPAAICFFR